MFPKYTCRMKWCCIYREVIMFDKKHRYGFTLHIFSMDCVKILILDYVNEALARLRMMSITYLLKMLPIHSSLEVHHIMWL